MRLKILWIKTGTTGNYTAQAQAQAQEQEQEQKRKQKQILHWSSSLHFRFHFVSTFTMFSKSYPINLLQLLDR